MHFPAARNEQAEGIYLPSSLKLLGLIAISYVVIWKKHMEGILREVAIIFPRNNAGSLSV
jgi:hypothetical protein